MTQDVVRVFRIIEYVGPRDWVEKTIARSIHGTKECTSYNGVSSYIKAATLGTYPEIMENKSLIQTEGDRGLDT